MMNNRKEYRSKRGSFAVLVFALAMIVSLIAGAGVSHASGGRIALTTNETTYEKGAFFTVVCRVSSGAGVGDTDFYVDFNTDIFKFMGGGSKATKETGGVHIQSTGNADAPMTRTYSLQFFAKKEGTGSIFIRQGADVTDSEGQPISLSTDKVDLVIGNVPGADASTPPGEPGSTPSASEPPKDLSKNNKVKDIVTNAIRFSPEFDPKVKEYEAYVGPDTETFFIDYILASKKARASISGNRNLSFGENTVKLVVTAENGDKRTYKFYVVKEQTDPNAETGVVVTGAAADANKTLDKEGKNSYSIILYILIAVLSIFCISLVVLVRRMRKEIESYEDMEDFYEKEDDTGSGEGDHEGGEIRGENGESRYWD